MTLAETLPEGLMAEVAGLKDKMAALEDGERDLGAKLQDLLSGLPNAPLPEVPRPARSVVSTVAMAFPRFLRRAGPCRRAVPCRAFRPAGGKGRGSGVARLSLFRH